MHCTVHLNIRPHGINRYLTDAVPPRAGFKDKSSRHKHTPEDNNIGTLEHAAASDLLTPYRLSCDKLYIADVPWQRCHTWAVL